MSDNVSQLHAQKHPGLGKRIAVFALLLVLVTGGVAAYVFRDRLNLDALQRYVRYLNVSEDSKTGRFVYDESNSNRYADLPADFLLPLQRDSASMTRTVWRLHPFRRPCPHRS